MWILDKAKGITDGLRSTINQMFAAPKINKLTYYKQSELRDELTLSDENEPVTRLENYAIYEEMDEECPEFSEALDSLSDLITQGDDVTINGYKTVKDSNSNSSDAVIKVEAVIDAKAKAIMKPESISKMEKVIKDFEDRTELKYNLKYYVRSALKYGDFFAEIVYGEMSESKQTVIAELLDVRADRIEIQTDQFGRLDKKYPYKLITLNAQKKGPNGTSTDVVFQPFEMFRIQIGGTAPYEYGRSIAHPARAVYQQLKAMETGMVVGRLVRAHQRYLYKVDTTNMPPDVALDYVRKVKIMMTKKKMTDGNGNIIYAKKPMTAEEDIYYPVKEKSRDDVELLKSDEFIGKIDDVKYFKDKLERILKVVRFGAGDSKGSRNAMAEADNSTIQYVKALQNLVRRHLERLYNAELMLHGIDQTVTVVMPDIASVNQIRKWEIENQKATISKVYRESGVLSKEYIRENILCLNEEELKAEKLRDEEAERKEQEKAATAFKQQQATAKSNGIKNPQGGGSARTRTAGKNKVNKTRANAYVTAKGANESQQTEGASDVTE